MRSRERCERDREDDDGFGCRSGVGSEDNDDTRNIRTIVPHGLERLDLEDEEQLVKQQRRAGAEGDIGSSVATQDSRAYVLGDDIFTNHDSLRKDSTDSDPHSIGTK